MSASFSYSIGHGECRAWFAWFFFKSLSICRSAEVDARPSRHHADCCEVRLMKLNDFSELVLRAVRAQLALFKSVTFSSYQQKNELSIVSLRQLAWHHPRMPVSRQPAKSYPSFWVSPPNCPWARLTDPSCSLLHFHHPYKFIFDALFFHACIILFGWLNSFMLSVCFVTSIKLFIL